MALAAAAAALVPEAARAGSMAAGLADPDYLVRYEALRIHGRSLTRRARGLGSGDSRPLGTRRRTSRCLAIDLLGNPKPHPDAAADLLRREAATLQRGRPGPARLAPGGSCAGVAGQDRT